MAAKKTSRADKAVSDAKKNGTAASTKTASNKKAASQRKESGTRDYEDSIRGN